MSDRSLLEIDQPTNIEERGKMTISIPNTENAQYSRYNKFLHVKSATGYGNPGFQTKLTFKEVPEEERAKYYLRCYLIRDNKSVRHIPIDKVCDKHLPANDTLPSHVLRHYQENNQDIKTIQYIKGAEGTQPSILFQLHPPENGTIEVTIRLYLMCYDSCRNTQNPDPKAPTKHSSRDLRMVQTLEIHKRKSKQTTHQKTWLIWPKAAVVKRELIMNPRRGPQGGKAQKNKRPSNYLDQIGTGTWNVDKDWVNKFMEMKAPKGEATLILTRDLRTGQTNAVMKSDQDIPWPP